MPDRLTPDRWQALEPILDAVLDADPATREAVIARLTSADPEARAEVERLLQSSGAAADPSILDRTAGEVFADLLCDDAEFVARIFAESQGGRYTIVRQAGAGGMATVYLARDHRHDRDVAIKILHPDLSVTLGADRFLAEIRTTARLQHPHLLPLLDSGEAGGQLFYVMPYVAGESLRRRLDQEGMLPVDDAVRIACEVAAALDHAHRHGVIHRDVKPENILLHEGQALVADWGIALAASAAGDAGLAGRSLLGTPHYMSPEQTNADRPVDARSDVYALGCVLYEMLTGTPPHTGSSREEVVARIRNGQPASLRLRRESVSPALESVVLRAISRLPADRFASAATFATALATPGLKGERRRDQARGRRALTGVVVGILGIMLAWQLFRPAPPPPVSRMLMTFPPGQGMASAESPRLAISPDGESLVYVGLGQGGVRLWLKRRNQLAGAPLAGTEGAEQPTFSPDGRRVAFYVRVGSQVTVRTVGLDGGDPITLVTSTNIAPSEVSSEGFRGNGLAWGDDDHLYMDGEGGKGVRRIPVGGGPVKHAVTSDTLPYLVWWPSPLPRSRQVLVTLAQFNATASLFQVAVMDPATGAHRVLAEGTFARYAAPGHLLYVTSAGELMAAPFDARRAELTGPAVKLLEGIDLSHTGGADLAISGEGTLVYLPGGGGQGSLPVWVDRDGREQVVDPAAPRWRALFAYGVSLSPDGTRLAYSPLTDDGIRQVWIKQLPQGPLARLTLDGPGSRPLWLDDRTLLFNSRRRDGRILDLWSQPGDGSAPPKLEASVGFQIQEFSSVRASSWTALRGVPREGGSDLYAIRLGVDSIPRPLLVTPFEERVPTVSPDGRYLAYVSNETGRQEVFVRPFPDVTSGRWQVSTNGGQAPLWSRSGTELFFVSEGHLVAAELRSRPGLTVLGSRPLFSMRDYEISVSRAFDEGPDGRFIMFRRTSRPVQELAVVEGFDTVLREATRSHRSGGSILPAVSRRP